MKEIEIIRRIIRNDFKPNRTMSQEWRTTNDKGFSGDDPCTKINDKEIPVGKEDHLNWLTHRSGRVTGPKTK